MLCKDCECIEVWTNQGQKNIFKTTGERCQVDWVWDDTKNLLLILKSVIIIAQWY